MITMLVAGLWHGPSWMYVIWGGLHGAGLIIQKINKPWLDKLPDNRLVTILSWLITFSFVTFLWIFFRSESMLKVNELISHIATNLDFAYTVPFFKARTTWCIFLILIFILHTIRPWQYDKLKEYFIRSPWIIKLILFCIVIQLVLQFQTGNVQPFIYFKF